MPGSRQDQYIYLDSQIKCPAILVGLSNRPSTIQKDQIRINFFAQSFK